MGISKAAYARHRGVSKPAVTKALKDGRIKELADGTIDVEEADAMWSANTKSLNTAMTAASRPASERRPPSGDVPDYNDARARNEAAKAALSELRLGEEQRRLLDRDEVRDAIFTLFRGIRDRLRSIPGRVCQQLIPMTDTREIMRLLQDEFDQALGEVADHADKVTPPVVGEEQA